jgi:hypothetical protein
VQFLLPGFEGGELGVKVMIELPIHVTEGFVGLFADYSLEDVQLG